MSIDWCRLWHDMPTDPKFRSVAKRSGRPTAEVLALFTAMLANASGNEDDRGRLRNWSHEDMGVALDIEPEHAEAIYNAMQGKLLDGERLTGWERRQPKREDNSAERVRAHRERKREQRDAPETPRNAGVTHGNAPDKEEDKEEEKKITISSASGTAREGCAAPRVDLDQLMKACDGALDNPANCMGLLTSATPIMWLEAGCDLDRDIIPALEAAGKKYHGKRIRSWDYFTGAITEARDRRLRGLPVPKAAASANPHPALTVSELMRRKREQEAVAA